MQKMEIEISEEERIDSLHVPGLKIIQNKKKFCFGMDAVLLADFALKGIYESKKNPSEEKISVVDFCTGNAIVPILMVGNAKLNPQKVLDCEKTGNETPENLSREIKIHGLELQDESFEMARRSVLLNGYENEIFVQKGDIKNYRELYEESSFDFVTCNPPYMLPQKGRQSQNLARMIARQELCCTLEDVVSAAAFVLKDGGVFFMIHRPERIDEIIRSLSKNHFSIKRHRFVLPFADSKPSMVLLECVVKKKIAEKELLELNLKTEPCGSLVIYKEENVYTEEVEGIYGRKAQKSQ